MICDEEERPGEDEGFGLDKPVEGGGPGAQLCSESRRHPRTGRRPELPRPHAGDTALSAAWQRKRRLGFGTGTCRHWAPERRGQGQGRGRKPGDKWSPATLTTAQAAGLNVSSTISRLQDELWVGRYAQPMSKLRKL